MASTKPSGSLGSTNRDDSVTGDISLLEYLDLPQLNCLNEADEHKFKPIVTTKSRNTTDSYLLSDADDQLLLNIPFNQAVRVRSVVLQSRSEVQAPKSIKLFVNRPSLGFEDVEDASEPEAAQVLTLRAEDVKQGNRIVLRYVRFQAVNSLHIFVQSNQGGDEESRIDVLEVFGVPVETTKDLSGLKKQEE
ncbi:hypothetical protein PILCRDRAFT_829691 [Piloderma croceum F 1598]|uniref:PITH domain-containing protein n=1 Tax=Piloderma croceum (strain F 1598) TaxID=765440 RepID=A0A0C3EXJ7_PILCF|nr:hypothetical protein PILCRDRAFT_829691 [Piloderma croceum F 1598]